MNCYRYRELVNVPQRRREGLEYRLKLAACVPCAFIGLATFLLLFPFLTLGLMISPAFWFREEE